MKSWRVLPLALGLLMAPLRAQDASLSAMDRDGNFFSVLNLFTGSYEFIQLRKIASNGSLLWSQARSLAVDERAAAAATDPKGGIAVAAVRKANGQRLMIVFHYTANGQYDWERVYNDNVDNLPTAAAVDRDGSLFIGGNALKGGRYVARLWKYDALGSFLWMREYDNGSGNTYTRQLQADLAGGATVGVESF
jgi:hypothetical protein